MLVRVKQFLSALTARLTEDDLLFVNTYLTTREKILFLGMDLPTQKHCIKVAHSSLSLAKSVKDTGDTKDFDLALLIKASLLHDIGKPAGGIKTWQRAFIVLANFLFPTNLVKKVKWFGLKEAYYLQKNHPFLGGQLAANNKLTPKLINIISRHHDTLDENSPMELRLLQKADGLN